MSMKHISTYVLTYAVASISSSSLNSLSLSLSFLVIKTKINNTAYLVCQKPHTVKSSNLKKKF